MSGDDHLDCPLWSTSQWIQGRSQPRPPSSPRTGGSPHWPSSSLSSIRGHDLTCSGCRDYCTVLEAAAVWIASSCQSQSWAGWWGSGAWCPRCRASSGTRRWAESAESAGSVRIRHQETRPPHHLKLYRISKVIQSEEVQPEAITRCTSQRWVKNTKNRLTNSIHLCSLMGHWSLITDLSRRCWVLTLASRHPDPASRPRSSDPRYLLSPEHSNYLIALKKAFADKNSNGHHLSLAGHGHCGAFGHNLRREAVNRQGQGGAPATPRIWKSSQVGF